MAIRRHFIFRRMIGTENKSVSSNVSENDTRNPPEPISETQDNWNLIVCGDICCISSFHFHTCCNSFSFFFFIFISRLWEMQLVIRSMNNLMIYQWYLLSIINNQCVIFVSFIKAQVQVHYWYWFDHFLLFKITVLNFYIFKIQVTNENCCLCNLSMRVSTITNTAHWELYVMTFDRLSKTIKYYTSGLEISTNYSRIAIKTSGRLTESIRYWSTMVD